MFKKKERKRILRKATRGLRIKTIGKQEVKNGVMTILEASSPTELQALSWDGAQVSAGPGEAVISCP